MSEMLGNQYFLSRNFLLALEEFENSLLKNPENLLVKKKLVLCYLKTGNITDAIKNVIDIVSKNPEIILRTDEKYDDCPCTDLIKEIEGKPDEEISAENRVITLALLWLYCDLQKSLELLNSIPNSSQHKSQLLRIIKLVNTFN